MLIPRTPTPSELTSSLIWLMLNSKPSILPSKSPTETLKFSMKFRLTSTLTLTGRKLEKLPESRIREAAVHAGPSLPLLLWKVLIELMDQTFSSLNKSWLTALAHMETKAATEDGWIKLSLTSVIRRLPLKPNIPTPLEMDPARMEEESIVLKDLSMSRDATTFATPWLSDQFQLLLMPQSGLPTDLVFWAAAEPLLTTESFWSGATWGESGYIRLAKGNTCAVCSYPSYPTIWCSHPSSLITF